MKKICLVVADDHRLFREGLHKLLSMEPDMTVVGEAADGVETLRVVRELVPDVLAVTISALGQELARVLSNLSTVSADSEIAVHRVAVLRATY